MAYFPNRPSSGPSFSLVSFLVSPPQCLTPCSYVVLLFIASPQWTTNDCFFQHSCEKGPFRLFLTKGNPTLEMGVLELALDVEYWLTAILPKALLRLHRLSSNRTRLKVVTVTVLIYQARWTTL